MTKTSLFAVTMIAALAALVLTLSIPSSYAAGGNCSGDCEAPTLGISDNGQRKVSGGFSINGQTFDVEFQQQEVPTQTVKTGDKVTIEALLHENSGTSYVSHASLSLGVTTSGNTDTSVATIAWDQSFNGDQEVTTIDPRGILKNVNVKATETGDLDMKLVFTFQVSEALDSSTIKFTAWDANRSVGYNYFVNALAITSGPVMQSSGDEVMMTESSDCVSGKVLLTESDTGKTACVLDSHIPYWNEYGWA